MIVLQPRASRRRRAPRPRPVAFEARPYRTPLQPAAGTALLEDLSSSVPSSTLSLDLSRARFLSVSPPQTRNIFPRDLTYAKKPRLHKRDRCKDIARLEM